MIKSITSRNFTGAIGIICLVAFFIIDNRDTSYDLESEASQIQEQFQFKEQQGQEALDEFIGNYEAVNASGGMEIIPNEQVSTLSNRSIFLFRYFNDSLKYWSDNSVPISSSFQNSGLQTGLNLLDNGWYFAILKHKDNSTYISLVLLKHAYKIDNNFLSNSFQSDFNIPDHIAIEQESKPGSVEVRSIQDNPAFHLSIGSSTSSTNDLGVWWWTSLVLLIVGIASLLSIFKRGLNQIEERFGWLVSLSLFLSTIFSLRYLSIIYAFPQAFYELDFFSPAHYATSSLSSSLGDYFLNSIIALYAVMVISETLKGRFISVNKPQNKDSSGFQLNNVLIGAALVLAYFGIFGAYNYLFEGLVLHSNISFNVNNFFELTGYSFFAFAAIGLFLFSSLLWVDFVARFLGRNSIIHQISAVAGGAIIYVGIALLFELSVIWTLALPLLVLVLLLWSLKSDDSAASDVSSSGYPLTTILIILVTTSIYVGQLTFFNSEIKERAQREWLADKLSSEKDQIAEYFFGEITKKIKSDTALERLVRVDSLASEQVLTRLKEAHLTDFWRKYDLQVTVCNEFDSLLIETESTPWGCNEFFKAQIQKFGKPTETPELFFMDNNNGRISYLAKINFDNVSLYIELDSKLIPEELGFPDLLLDFEGVDQVRTGLKKYSYAKYIDALLVDQSGEFKYKTSWAFPADSSNNQYLTLNGYHHLVRKINDHSIIVLSKPSNTLLDALVRFSYLFAFSCLGGLLFYLSGGKRIRFSFTELNFQQRIQYSMILILLVSLVPIGLGTKYYIENQYNTKNQENIKEKIQSVLIEVEHKLANETTIDKTLEDYLSFLLVKFSFVFFTDINLFDLNGNLLATSRPEIFDQGLIGTKMNVTAFTEMAGNNQTEFVHNEKVGNLEFLSAYVPFRNENNEVLAYLNLPYFAKENTLQKEISTFLVALINFYVMLMIAAVFIALFLSNNITQPLRLIQQKLSTIRVGQQNEPIAWQGKDEISALVQEYNRMIDELSTSAELLAKSERESAWREMAKQVAHEIKNPLTPMKLSVQHLERAWEDKAPDWDERLKKFSKTIIQQIDSLSIIATEFSDFAAMPKTNIEAINLVQIIDDVIELYKDEEHAQIRQKTSDSTKDNEATIKADREQIIRVLNNLIINAIQATTSDSEIIVQVQVESKECIVSIQDNGTGIPESEKDKIFTPSFTTKTSGKGLGLAIVKSIVENSNGKVWFESEEGRGSTFYFSMPRS